jgi:uncharacterized membrane protein
LQNHADVWAVIGLSIAAVCGILLRCPLTQPIDVGTTWLVGKSAIVYALPAALGACMLLTAYRSSRGGIDIVASLSWVLAWFWLVVAIRHLFTGFLADISWSAWDDVEPLELPTAAGLTGLAGLGAWYMGSVRNQDVLRMTGTGLYLLACLVIADVLLFHNPMVVGHDVGEIKVVNRLLVIYGIPLAVLAGGIWMGRRAARPELRFIEYVNGILAMAVVWMLVTLEVRQGFHGGRLGWEAPTEAEWYAYSAGWLVLGAAMLAAGVATGSNGLRWGSLVVMVGTVGKVFLFDTRHLQDLWRAGSYLGLGACLLLMAWVYQRFVFRRGIKLPLDGENSPHLP